MARSTRYAVSSVEEMTYRPKFHSYETADVTMTYEVMSNNSTKDDVAPLVMSNGTSQRRTFSMYETKASPKIDPDFLIACKNSDESVLERIVEEVPSFQTINQQDRCGRTGLYHVCSNGHLKMLEILVQLAHLDVNLADSEGNTPLIAAAQAGHVEIVGLLLDKYKDVLLIDQRNVFGMTALMKAALQGKTKCVKLLLSAGANPNLCDPRRQYCPLQWARFCCRYSCAEAIEKFMKTNNKTFLHNKLFSTSNKWSSDPEIRTSMQEVRPPKSMENSWFKQKLKKTFRYADHKTRKSGEVGALSNITSSTVMCASSAILQNIECDQAYKEIIIPKLEVLHHNGK
ncbi:ankycorbin-like [Centruroides vittatus]|uniref:ankycorbin-like n=1 Tax=Centruroides vittatus TaxID=120091 RepID=UPI003510A644